MARSVCDDANLRGPSRRFASDAVALNFKPSDRQTRYNSQQRQMTDRRRRGGGGGSAELIFRRKSVDPSHVAEMGVDQ